MSSLIFATGNERKIIEATTTLAPLGITVEQRAVDIDEIQHHNPSEITKAKARAAYVAINQPVVVQDTSWSIPALGGFPGGYMKDVAEWWAAEDWITIMSRHSDQTIYCHEHVAYFDGEHLEHFEHTYRGYFVSAPRGIGDSQTASIERVVCLYGDKTMAEMYESQGVASAGETLEHWLEFGEWYSKKST